MATSTETINKQSKEEPMISRDDIQFKQEIITSLDMNMMLQAVKALDITSLGNFKAQVETLWQEKSTATEGFSVAEAAAANGFDKGKVLTYEDLQLLSNNFSPDNYMGRTHCGVLYKGFVPEGWKGMRSGEATIKMWKNERFVKEDRIVPEHPECVRFSMEQEI